MSTWLPTSPITYRRIVGELLGLPRAVDETLRYANPHISFGIGEHYCLGVHLARPLKRGSSSRSSSISSPTSSLPGRKASNFNNGLDSLPIRLSRTAC